MLVAEELEAKKQKGWRKCWTSANLSQLSPSTTALSHVQTLARPCCGRSCCQGCNLGEFLMECRKMDGFVGFPFLHICHSKDYDLLTNSGNVISSNLDEKSGWFFFFLLEAQDLAKAALAQRDAREGGLIFLADASYELEMLKEWQQKKIKKDWIFWRGWPGSKYSSQCDNVFFLFFFSGEELEGDSLPGAGNVPQLAAAPAPLAVPAAGLEALAPELLQTPGSTVQLQDAAQLKGGVDFFFLWCPQFIFFCRNETWKRKRRKRVGFGICE